MSNLTRAAAVCGAVAVLLPLSACDTVAPTATRAPTPTPSASASATAAVDLTQPGAARSAIRRLLAAAGADHALMVSVTRSDASVTVLRNGAAQTWALRGGDPRQVQSDTTYVSQAAFDPERFDLSDVGALFRAAASVSGSDARQELQLVEYSGGLVMMTVSTNPESRTVFFTADGELLPTLDFSSVGGLTRGLADAVGARSIVYAIGMGDPSGVYADVPGLGKDPVSRRQRTARLPVVVTPRNDPNPLPGFDPQRIDAAVVWRVLQGLRQQGTWRPGEEWTCVADDRDRRGVPRLHFQVGGTRFVTDLTGQRVDS